MNRLLVVLVFLAGCASQSPEGFREVSAAQVSFYQLGMETGCKDAGRRRSDPPERVETFCNCMMKTLKEHATQEEWQRAYFHSRKREDREEMQALAPHMPKVQACRANAL
jgi:hypothetical protein